METLKDVININANVEEYDGVYFIKNPADDEKWDFSFMRMSLESENNFHIHPVGFIYKILHLNRNGNGIDVFEAVIGDPNHYIKNMIKSNQEGLIIKKCDRAEQIFDLVIKKYEEILA